MEITKEHKRLIEKTIKAHMKHFNLKVKNGYIYKGNLVVYTEDLKRRDLLLSFLEGLSVGEWLK